MTTNVSSHEHYRPDGVRITHDPYAPGMAEKYGTPGRTDDEGFDPYADSVGPGIYGGIVLRHLPNHPNAGDVVIGRQYQDHNPRPGPVYAGGGYAPSTLMLEDADMLTYMLNKYPDLVNDVTTGGAQPLHMCGMSPRKQLAARRLIEIGADIEALDTYGMTPLQRMASNNLAIGARVLLEAGADVTNEGKCGRSPLRIARGSAANEVVEVLMPYLKKIQSSSSEGGSSGSITNVIKLIITGSEGAPEVCGEYHPRSSTNVPRGFADVCESQGWDVLSTWARLNGVNPDTNVWFAHAKNDSYAYHNKADGRWWIDGPDGKGVWIVDGPSHAPPSRGWMHVTKRTMDGGPMVRTLRELKGGRK
jgi:hypothetical protein